MSAPILPGFTYLDHLGSGGFADVYLYEQEWPRQRVAVKVMRPGIPITEREKELFTAEANAMAKLGDHPYIVSVLTAGITTDGRPFLVMRYCPPPDLGVRVRSNPMSVADAVSTGIKLASAIETAHLSGILHRDIKPSNVLVTTYHQPALTDFGIAGHIQEVAGESDVRVSYPWSPPELLDGRSNGAVASDVYSLGATIWHLLVGRSPYSVPNGDNSTRALSARILHASPPATQRPDVPPGLDRLLQQCLAKQPAQRPASALELARTLQQIEAACGFPRTQIAVEGGRPELPVDRGPESDEQGTAMRPVRVISAAGASNGVPVPEVSPDADAADPTPRSARAWAAVAVGAVVAVALAFWLGGGQSPKPATEVADPPPNTLTPGGLQAVPSVELARKGARVTVSWSTTGEVREGDRWHLARDDTGATRWIEEGSRTSITLNAPGPLCVQIFQERQRDISPVGQACTGGVSAPRVSGARPLPERTSTGSAPWSGPGSPR